MRMLEAGCVECWNPLGQYNKLQLKVQMGKVLSKALPLSRTTQSEETLHLWQLHLSTGYNLGIPTTAVPPVGATMKSARRFRASTLFAASKASEDPFTERAIEEFKEAINTDVISHCFSISKTMTRHWKLFYITRIASCWFKYVDQIQLIEYWGCDLIP